MSKQGANSNTQKTGMAHVTPKKRPSAMTPREYQTRLDYCRVWELVCMNKTQAEIAREIGKDPGWVSRTIKKIESDFSVLHTNPEQTRIVSENLLTFQMLRADALKMASTSQGRTRIAALRLASEIAHKIADYQMTVGLVRKAPSNVHLSGNVGAGDGQLDFELLRNEFREDDLDQICLEIADNIRARQAEQASESACA